ncbi:MAG: aminoacyl-tRNA hydrolase, partial [Planctomycetota bacterium]
MADNEDKLKIVVGLGNPGPKYNRTRHNIGFQVIDALAKKLGASLPNGKFEGEISSLTVSETRMLLVRPLTFMNCSGRCVSPLCRFYKVDVEQDLLIVCDDLSLPLGKLRARMKGSAGGQNGLKDILRSLGTQSIARLRIGIGQPPPKWDA